MRRVTEMQNVVTRGRVSGESADTSAALSKRNELRKEKKIKYYAFFEYVMLLCLG